MIRALFLLVFFALPSIVFAQETKPKISYLALGDSYTIGEGVKESERWPVLLAEQLGWNAPTIIAQTGWTSKNLRDALDDATLEPSYDRVTLLIGVNDQFQGKSKKSFRKNFRVLLERSVKLAGGKKNVLVVSIPDYSVTPFARRFGDKKAKKEIKAFNAICRAEAKKAGVAFVNITPISRKAKKDADLLAGDRLHPSGKMYREWIVSVVAPHFVDAKTNQPKE